MTPSGDIEDDWSVLRNNVYTTSSELPGSSTRKNQDCFDEKDDEIKALLEEKHRLYRAFKIDPTSTFKIAVFLQTLGISRPDSGACKTSGLTRRQKRLKAMPRDMTPSASLILLRLYMVFSSRESLHRSVQMA